MEEEDDEEEEGDDVFKPSRVSEVCTAEEEEDRFIILF